MLRHVYILETLYQRYIIKAPKPKGFLDMSTRRLVSLRIRYCLAFLESEAYTLIFKEW